MAENKTNLTRPENSPEGTGVALIPLKDLASVSEIRKRLDVIDNAVRQTFDENRGEPEALYDTAAHLLGAGGKRVRSLLMLLSCEAVGGEVSDMLPYAVATEFMQTASLIHDDLIDDDDMRRGVESTHRRFGSKMAVLAGDLLIGLAVKLVGEQATPELLTMVAGAGIKMCEGEAADIQMLVKPLHIVSKDEYFDIVGRKTASFMKSVARVGGILGGAKPAQEEMLAEYGEMLGLAFQIRDDILDVVSTRASSGKSVLSDLRGNRPNYVLVHALEVCPDELTETCLKALAEGEVARALELIERVGAIRHSQETARTYAKRAVEAIAGKGLANEELLVALASFSVEREK
jgi:geranylgeranyl diphosphate synthase type I